MDSTLVFKILLSISCNGESCELPSQDSWGFIDNHWVYKVTPGLKPAGSSACPGGDMIEVKGSAARDVNMNPYGVRTIEYLQKTTCTKWINKNFPERCAVFDQTKWEQIRSSLPRSDMHFCIDPYEWPNEIGAAPWIMVTWHEATKLCESKGKRLCTEDEWTFACEGEEVLPYPYGYERDPTKCNIDRQWILYEGSKMIPRGTKKCGDEMLRLWKGHASGADPQCVSPFGAYDMTGNIDEWTVATRASKYPSILKGGYWGPVRSRCRPSTRNHDQNHSFYQQGFRCCSDVKSAQTDTNYFQPTSI